MLGKKHARNNSTQCIVSSYWLDTILKVLIYLKIFSLVTFFPFAIPKCVLPSHTLLLLFSFAVTLGLKGSSDQVLALSVIRLSKRFSLDEC